MLADPKTALVAEVVQSQPPAYDQAVTATVVRAQLMVPPMVVTCPPGVTAGQPMRVVDPAVAPASSATRRCRGCGVQFELDARTNPASAAAFRCKKCRQISFSNFF